MSYIINLTNGAKLTEVIDGSIDQSASDITLIGKNISNYGVFFNDNLVHMLENFANTTEPANPLLGQLWYDSSINVLKVYNGQGFAPTGNTIVSTSQPTNLASGTLWIDSYNKQLKFYDGVDLLTAGPIYTANQGVSGFEALDVIDTNQIVHTILPLYVGGTLIGVFSKDDFTPAYISDIPGYNGTSIVTGFNVASQSGFSFDMEVTRALALVDANGVSKTTDSFMSAVDDTYARGTVSFLNNIPFKLGAGEELQVEVGSLLTQFKSNKINQNLQITARRDQTVYDPSIFVNAASQYVGIYTDSPGATLDVNGNTIIRGNLTVEGATTTVNTTNLVIEDQQIELGKVATPTDTTANNGGILLWGTSNKTFQWRSANGAWVSSESIELASGNTYKISGQSVLTYSSLGATVTSAPGLTSVGHLTSLAAGWLTINNNTIGYSHSPDVDGNIILDPAGAGYVSVSNAKISNLAAPAADTDATNRLYVNNTVMSSPLSATVTTTATLASTNYNILVASDYLAWIHPASEHIDGTKCRVVCYAPDGVAIKEYWLTGGVWTFQSNIHTPTL